MYCCFVACSFIRNLRLVYNDMVTFYIFMMELYHDKISRKNAIILIEIYKPLSFLVGTYRNLHSDNSWHHNLVPRSEPWTKVPMIWLIFWPMNVPSVGRSELPAWMTTGSCPGSAPAANQMYTPRCYMLSFYLFVPLVRTHWMTILLLLHKLRKLKVEPPEDQDELQYQDYFDRSGPSKRPPCMAITAAT